MHLASEALRLAAEAYIAVDTLAGAEHIAAAAGKPAGEAWALVEVVVRKLDLAVVPAGKVAVGSSISFIAYSITVF
jgi:hypothetical protein